MTARMNRRLYGFFAKRLDEAGLELVPDGRDDRGKRWDLGALLRTVLGAMLTGARSLADVEEMTERMSSPMKRLLMRDVLFALVTTTRQQLDGLRRHNIATLC